MRHAFGFLAILASFAHAQTRPTTLPSDPPGGVLGRELEAVIADTLAAQPNVTREQIAAELRPVYPQLRATADEDRAFLAGKFDDAGNRTFCRKASDVMKDFAARPNAVLAYLADADKTAPLIGVRLELLARLYRGAIEQLKQPLGPK